MIKEKYESGIEIISKGDLCSSITFLVHGKIDIEIETEDGTQVVQTLKRGDMIGCKSVLDGSELDFTAITASNVTTFVLTKEYFDTNASKQ